MNILISVTGSSPVLHHNPRLADPDDEFARAISEITRKRQKTEEDRREIDRLEWYGGLYTEDSTNGKPPLVVLPASKLRKCIIEAGRLYRLGKRIEQALFLDDLNLPLIYEGPREINKLWESKAYLSRLSVVIQGKRVMRVRPQFYPWSLVASGVFLPEVMDVNDLCRCIEVAGRAIGLSDDRVNGYGRFRAEVSFER